METADHVASRAAGSGLVAALPKAELHVHIEGTLEPEMMFVMAERNRIDLPYTDVGAVRAAYDFDDLQSFLDLYYQGAAVLQTEQDFSDLAYSYLERAAKDNVRHVEMFFDPQTHTNRGVPFDVVVEGLVDGLARSAASNDLSADLIMCFLRHLSEDEAMATLEQAAPHRHRILGVGLDSAEIGHPPSDFAHVFAAAREAGFRIVAHAGEEGPPEYVWQALDVLGVERIDHGVRSMEDGSLVARLVNDQMPLTVCPLSNRKLQVTPDLGRHPLPEMIEAGLLCSINSDDPAYFGGYIGRNYARSAVEMGLSDAVLAHIARSSFVSSFLTEERKTDLIADVDEAARAHGLAVA